MKVDIKISAYDVAMVVDPSLVTSVVLANALGSKVSLTGIQRVTVLTGCVSFAMSTAAYDFYKANLNVKSIVDDAKQAVADADEAVEKVKEVSLKTFPTVAINKAYWAELQADADKWTAFMDTYDGYMLYIIDSEETGPITPTPVTFRGFGSKFGFLFGSSTSTSKGFGSKFGFLFGN